MPRFWGMNLIIDGSWYASKGGAGKLSPAFSKVPTAPGAPPPIPGKPDWVNYVDNVVRPASFNGPVDIYEYDTQEVIRAIAGNAVGSIIVGAINASDRECRVIPRDYIDSITGNPAVAKPMDWSGAMGKTGVLCKVMRGGCGPIGTDSIIEFQPYSLRFAGGNAAPDNVLLHEFVHALREMRGKWLTGPAPAGFPNIEELLAVMVENMYLSSMGRNSAIRLNYNNIPEAGSPAELEARFVSRFPVEIGWFVSQLTGVSKQLGSLSVPFNPLRSAAKPAK